jgi:His/Glu/Gln/Arg/opine family amino acid ABC transporter permease subunit
VTFLDILAQLAQGISYTVLVTIVCSATGLAVGLSLASLRRLDISWLSPLIDCYTYVFRGIPVLVLLFMVYFGLPEVLVAFILGCVLLWFCWIPPSQAARDIAAKVPYPFFWVGLAHTFLSTVSGAGVLFQSVMVNSKLPKEGVVATIAGTLLFMALFKSIGYLIAGFDYMPYVGVIALSWIMGISGTMIGKMCLDILPDTYFRLLIKVVISLFSLRLFWTVGAYLIAS